MQYTAPTYQGMLGKSIDSMKNQQNLKENDDFQWKNQHSLRKAMVFNEKLKIP